MIAVLPFAEHFSSGQAAAATHSACSIPSVVIFVGCHDCRAVWYICASPTMWSQWPEVFHTPWWKHHSRHHAGQRRHVSVVAACLPVAGCRPPSLQCGMADVGPSPCKRVEVQWKTRSTRCAFTLGNETPRPLICVACAGSSESSISMPLGVEARSSPDVVHRERPPRSSWCEFRSQITAADQDDECCSQSEQHEQLPIEGRRGSPRTCWGWPVDTRGGRWPPGSWFQQRQALARQGVAHHEGHASGTPTAGLVGVTGANEPRRWHSGVCTPAEERCRAGAAPVKQQGQS
ncbi:hypothetical protein TcBrA4_0020970 [Trypanosoma cruzi]|nr:hypothetical protein TcBrA4_0020970 [Trypanosoma cruzi]